MVILGIDPGPQDSAGVLWDTETEHVVKAWHRLNDEVLAGCRQFKLMQQNIGAIAIEDPQAQRRPASEDFINTVKWSARFHQAIYDRLDIGDFSRLLLIPYREVSIHFCKIVNAKEKFVKEALIKRFGLQGTKTNPGRLYGISGHEWSALAVAITLGDRMTEKKIDILRPNQAH